MLHDRICKGVKHKGKLPAQFKGKKAHNREEVEGRGGNRVTRGRGIKVNTPMNRCFGERAAIGATADESALRRTDFDKMVAWIMM